MDKIISCLECGKVCQDDAQLHRHLKAHKMSQGNYYVKHFPRHDKLDGTPIIFKNRDWYFSADFNSRHNLKDWLNQVSKEEAIIYVRELLLTRKLRKNLLYTPSQVELRSLPLPGMVYMGNLFGDYYAECEKLGFINRFNKLKLNGVWKEFDSSHKVFVDTREQLPLVFGDNLKTIHEKLDFGDYKLNDDIFTDKVCVERKSMGDLYHTMTTNYERFYQELLRAKNAGFYLIVLVEEPFEKLYDLSRRMKNIDIVISPEYVMYNVRKLTQQFHDSAQFLFVNDRDEASEVIIKIFKSAGQFRHVDIQYTYDTGQII